MAPPRTDADAATQGLFSLPARPSRRRLGGRGEPPPQGLHADPAGFSAVRLTGDEDEAALARFFGELPRRAGASGGGSLRVLALSGGGAGGAFGAGALVGLSRAGARPDFDVVTGVSTGALIAPLAFLGKDWDDRLARAYTGGDAADLLGFKGLRPGPSLYASEPLANLVRRYVDADLLSAVAQAHQTGRRLFVATANLDAETTVIWDLGAIAARANAAAQQLFADVLIASASLPGVFPPKMIAVQSGGLTFEEMHVDGGAIAPLFVVPEPLILRRARDWGASAVEVYALVNTTLQPSLRATPMGMAPILVRSFELMLRSSYRGALRSVAAFCEINGFALRTASVPAEFGAASMLRFDQGLMSCLFARGAALAQAGQLWSPATALSVRSST